MIMAMNVDLRRMDAPHTHIHKPSGRFVPAAGWTRVARVTWVSCVTRDGSRTARGAGRAHHAGGSRAARSARNERKGEGRRQ